MHGSYRWRSLIPCENTQRLEETRHHMLPQDNSHFNCLHHTFLYLPYLIQDGVMYPGSKRIFCFDWTAMPLSRGTWPYRQWSWRWRLTLCPTAVIEELEHVSVSSLFVFAGLKSISRCSKLSSLKLGICLNITDEGLTRIGMCCSKLTQLDLYRLILAFCNFCNLLSTFVLSAYYGA